MKVKATVTIDGVEHHGTVLDSDYLSMLGLLFYTQSEKNSMMQGGVHAVQADFDRRLRGMHVRPLQR